jgi:hypothetical protein
MSLKYWTGSHTKHRLLFHIVFLPKYRRKVMNKPVANRLKNLFYEGSKINNWWIDELEIQPDQILTYRNRIKSFNESINTDNSVYRFVEKIGDEYFIRKLNSEDIKQLLNDRGKITHRGVLNMGFARDTGVWGNPDSNSPTYVAIGGYVLPSGSFGEQVELQIDPEKLLGEREIYPDIEQFYHEHGDSGVQIAEGDENSFVVTGGIPIDCIEGGERLRDAAIEKGSDE